MSNNFCRFLSNGVSLHLNSSKISARPCCWFSSSTPFTSSDSLKHLHLVDDWIPGCRVCKQQEDSGHQSFRQASFDIIPDTDPGIITAIDINLDYDCNSACITCDSDQSTLWGKELKKFKISHTPTPVIGIEKILGLLNSLDLSQVKRVKFFGGEPLFNNVHLEILKQFPAPENIDVWYTSNASIYPKQEILDTWAKFKIVFFEASIDGIGEQFEYIRWPLKWGKVEDTLLRLKNSAPPNVLFRINFTASPLNVLYYNRLTHWVETNFSSNRLGDKTEINIHPCWGVWALTKTPTPLRQAVYDLYPDSPIGNLLKHTGIDKSYSSMVRFVNQWDTKRGNSWKLAFPELVEYINLDQQI